jgi:hypothetical protein
MGETIISTHLNRARTSIATPARPSDPFPWYGQWRRGAPARVYASVARESTSNEPAELPTGVKEVLILVANSQNPSPFVEVSRINLGIPSGARQFATSIGLGHVWLTVHELPAVKK